MGMWARIKRTFRSDDHNAVPKTPTTSPLDGASGVVKAYRFDKKMVLEIVRISRLQQDLPIFITDPAVIARLVVLVRNVRK